jgi:hypothetical protein
MGNFSITPMASIPYRMRWKLFPSIWAMLQKRKIETHLRESEHVDNYVHMFELVDNLMRIAQLCQKGKLKRIT